MAPLDVLQPFIDEFTKFRVSFGPRNIHPEFHQHTIDIARAFRKRESVLMETNAPMLPIDGVSCPSVASTVPKMAITPF
jgi:hypothetical protein